MSSTRPPGARRRTKIVATIGPASRSPETLTRLVEAGADVFRLNFSHGTPAEHAENVARVREVTRRSGRDVAILGDLPGPKLRIDAVEDGAVGLLQGTEIELTTEQVVGTATRLHVSYEGLPGAVDPGGEIYMADGRIRLRVIESDRHSVRCAVEVGGPIASFQGVNLPGVSVGLPAVGSVDLEWVEFAVANDLDLLAVSYVSAARDVLEVERQLAARGSDIPVIAKIERSEAIDNAAEIIGAAVAGVMIARGDLGIERPMQELPALQRRLLKLAGELSKPAITATQMLASMVTSPRPTRAEVSDVAAAIRQGTDAVMLSEETAIGEYPVEAVAALDAIARETELDLPYGAWLTERVRVDGADVASSVARGAVASTYAIDGLAAIVVPTSGGRTARLVSAHRPAAPVLAVSHRPATVRRMNLLFGVRSAHAAEPQGISALLDECARLSREAGVAGSGDLIAITAGLPSQQLGTNLFEIHRVP